MSAIIMKSYTDLEQSKKLAEILPIESADFHFSANQSPNGYLEKPIWGNPEYADYSAFPCWSPISLLEVLPHRIDDRHTLVLGKLSANEGWYVCYDDNNGDIDYYVTNSNLIDACYTLILKLHEQELL